MILVDTGYWLALSNTKDRHHVKAKEAAHNLKQKLITTWPVLTETCHLLAVRHGSASQQAFLEIFTSGACLVFSIEERHFPRIIELICKYRDLPMDLADASLVLAAEVLGEGHILSTDIRDYRTYRWKNRKPFHNLMEPL